MYNLNEETKKTIAESIGVPYEKLINMEEYLKMPHFIHKFSIFFFTIML